MRVHTVWDYSEGWEAARVVHAASNVARGFYGEKGFWVLPRLVVGDARCVYLPEWKFNLLKRFWERVRMMDAQWLIKDVDVEIVREMERLMLDKGYLLPDSGRVRASLAGMTNKWGLIEDNFWELLEDVLPEVAEMKLEVKILPTGFGTVASFLSWREGETLQVRVWWRVDSDLGHVAEGIVSALWAVRMRERRRYSWEESEAAVDFLMVHTRLRKLFPGFEPTLERTRKKEEGLLAEESKKYMERLGLHQDTCLLADDKGFWVADTLLQLSENEEKILRKLWMRRGETVEFEELGETVWKSDGQFSLWALAQYVYQLRRKIEKAGGNLGMIQSRRKLGYVLC